MPFYFYIKTAPKSPPTAPPCLHFGPWRIPHLALALPSARNVSQEQRQPVPAALLHTPASPTAPPHPPCAAPHPAPHQPACSPGLSTGLFPSQVNNLAADPARSDLGTGGRVLCGCALPLPPQDPPNPSGTTVGENVLPLPPPFFIPLSLHPHLRGVSLRCCGRSRTVFTTRAEQMN